MSSPLRGSPYRVAADFSGVGLALPEEATVIACVGQNHVLDDVGFFSCDVGRRSCHGTLQTGCLCFDVCATVSTGNADVCFSVWIRCSDGGASVSRDVETTESDSVDV